MGQQLPRPIHVLAGLQFVPPLVSTALRQPTNVLQVCGCNLLHYCGGWRDANGKEYDNRHGEGVARWWSWGTLNLENSFPLGIHMLTLSPPLPPSHTIRCTCIATMRLHVSCVRDEGREGLPVQLPVTAFLYPQFVALCFCGLYGTELFHILSSITVCSVTDGSAASTTYPCACGTATCSTAGEYCTAATNQCDVPGV